MQHLQPNSTLQGGKYKIKKVLGQGGFGITYLAENTMLDGKVAIKEFFFKEYCDRDEATSHVTIGTSGNREIVERFKVKFIKEARTIFKLNHPNIVRILDIFEENGTAYYVMDYIEGESLSDMVKRRGFIPEAESVGYIKNVADALSYIHSKNMNHLDIKPGNIMKRQEDGQIFVIDFGVAKQYDSTTSEGTTTTPVGISKGYSPNEQYMLGGVQSFSPQSDVYALAATLFKLLTGNTPPEAMLIQDEGLPTEELKAKNISQNIINALDAAMQSKRKRTHSVEEFISNLNGSASVVNSDDEATLYTPEMQHAEEERKRKETEAKAAKEKAEAEARAKAEAERKVREEMNRERELEKVANLIEEKERKFIEKKIRNKKRNEKINRIVLFGCMIIILLLLFICK
ncbi:MAG: serine/threonine protein kinase [Bacteroidaceae bacterium]|nr:serine/threonine protein kinase [Bacteroidaceae bacterium]